MKPPRNTQQRPGHGKRTHDVMIRPEKNLHQQLKAIAEAEHRDAGPQALKFVEEGIARYLAEHPKVADLVQAQP